MSAPAFPPRKAWLTAALGGLGVVAAIAACGGGSDSHRAARPTPNPAQVASEFAQCVRQHGDSSFPDPVMDANGNPQLPPGTAKPTDEEMQACGAILNRLPVANRSDQHPDPAVMRRFARCMRDQGIQDWPDPDSQGLFHFPPELANFKASPRWSQIQAAWEGPCKQYNPYNRVWGAS
jgi:hypothetical protein